MTYDDLDELPQWDLEHEVRRDHDGPYCEACGDCLVCYGEDPCFDGGPHQEPPPEGNPSEESDLRDIVTTKLLPETPGGGR